MDDLLSINNSKIDVFVDHIYHSEHEIKHTIYTGTFISYLDLHIEIDIEDRLRTKLYEKRDDLSFLILNFPFICSNIPAAPAHIVCILQMIRYSRACGSYKDFLDRGLLLTMKLLNKGVLEVKLKASLRKFYRRHHDMVNRYLSPGVRC